MPHLRGAAAVIYACRDREVLIEGRAGTGKTYGALQKIIDLCRTYPGSRHLICRQTRASMTESTLVTLEKLIGPAHPEVTRVQRDQRHSYRLHGSEIVTGGLDKPDRLFSTEWDTVYANEGTEITENSWELFGRAMRHRMMPYSQRMIDCNPNNPGHWLNQRAARCDDSYRTVRTPDEYNRTQDFNHSTQLDGKGRRPKMRRLIGLHFDNPAFWDIDRWRWTRDGRDYVLGELAAMTGHRRVRMFQGLWKAASGTVYPEFTDRHICPPWLLIPRAWPIYVGIDPGYDHPTAILWFVVTPDRRVIVIDEHYAGGMSVAEHAAVIHRKNLGRTIRGYYADPQHAFSKTAQSPDTIADQYAAEGISIEPWPRTAGNEEHMVEYVRDHWRRDKLLIYDTCVNTIREHQLWSYKRTVQGELPPGDDKFEDKDNHTCDVVKGVLNVPIDHPAIITEVHDTAIA